MATSPTAEQPSTEIKRLSLKEKEVLESSVTFTHRINPGVEGKAIQLRVNFFDVSSASNKDIYHYDFSITPLAPPRLNRCIFDQLIQANKDKFGSVSLAYDGRANMYTSQKLGQNVYSFDLALEKEGKKERKEEPDADPEKKRVPRNIFQIKIKQVAVVSMDLLNIFLKGQLNYTPYEAIQALEVVVRQAASRTDMININRSFFSPKKVARLSGPVDAWLGYFQSLRPSLGRLLLNVDVAASTFYRDGAVLELVASVISGGGGGGGGYGQERGPPRTPSSLNEQERTRLERAIRGIRIAITHRPIKRKYKVLGISNHSAERTVFEDAEGRQISVAEYFERQYKLRLRYPGLPCLRVGSSDRPIFLPIEVCEVVPAQRYIRKLNEYQTADMIKVCCQKPQQRMERILEGVGAMDLLDNPLLRDFGISVGRDLLRADARVLRPPKVFYGRDSKQSEVTPEDGAWNLRDRRVFTGAKLESWAILNLSRSDEREVEGFVRELVMTSRDLGLDIRLPNPPIFRGPPDVGGIERLLNQAYAEGAKAGRSSDRIAQLVLVIIPQKDTLIYGEVKRVTDCLIGRPSQCIVSRHVGRPNKQMCANVAIKMNAKLGGVNSSLGSQLTHIVDVPTIVFGADVTHPGLGETSRRSMAAVVASMDPMMSRYTSLVRVQESNQEVITDLQDIVKQHLISFNQLNRGVKPQRILFYRDGVSEGQFSHILNTEVAAIHKACQELEATYKPKLTFVVVQKRHHVRFFPMDRANTDRSGNVQAGTVVDSAITHPIYRDFFLLSHSGIQGTSRPTHYHIIKDENEFSSDEIQSLTYRLCYTYARCTRSVSVSPPAYYAHLVAFRSRFHVKADEGFSMASSGSAEPSGVFMCVRPELEKTMYFC